MAFGLDDIIAEGLKTCSICKKEQSVSEYRFRSDQNAYRKDCKTCCAKRNKNYYSGHSEIIKERSKQQRIENQEQALLNSAKASARNKGLEFNLELTDIIIPSHCKYLGILLTNIQGEGVSWSNASIDRIDSSLGYIKGNIQIISRKANTMKQDATEEELKSFARAILGETK